MPKQQRSDEAGTGKRRQQDLYRPSLPMVSRFPDHIPHHPGDPGKLQAYAFGYGYINAPIIAANSEVS